MDEREMARVVGSIRLGVGAALVAAPGFAGRVWIGPGADDRGAHVFARAIGARDVLLGARTLAALKAGEPVRGWLKLGFAADGADAAATLLAARHLTPLRRLAMPAIAAAVGAMGYWAAGALD